MALPTKVPQPSDITPEYFSIPGAVKFSSISRASIYRALDAKELEARKLGRRTLIARESLDAWIAQHSKPYEPAGA